MSSYSGRNGLSTRGGLVALAAAALITGSWAGSASACPPCGPPCVVVPFIRFEQRTETRYRTEYRTEYREVQRTVCRQVPEVREEEVRETVMVPFWREEVRE